MASVKLNALSLFSSQTPLPTPKSPHQKLAFPPSKGPSSLHRRAQLMIPISLPKLPLKTITREEEEARLWHHKNPDSLSVAFPSLAFSNTLFFSSAYNVQVIAGDNEPEDTLISRFRREVLKAGVIQECKRRRFFESTQEKRKRKTREAAKRNRKRRHPQPKASRQVKAETSKKNVQDSDDDNWEFFDVDLPYC